VAEYDERSNSFLKPSSADGKPVVSANGYASWRSSYDEHGRVIRTACYGASGEPVLHKNGNHGWVTAYDERGNQIAQIFIGLDGKPLP
jgi:hypothetical protein